VTATENEDSVSPHPTESYHKARRLFALLSGILLAWEYVGIRVGQQNAGGNGISGQPPVAPDAKLPIFDMPMTFEHPEVIPSVILILVMYFGIRYTIEWLASTGKERGRVAWIADRVIAYMIGVLAISVFALQRMSAFRLANIITPTALVALVIGGIASFWLSYSSILFISKHADRINLTRTGVRWLLIYGSPVAVVSVVAVLLYLLSAIGPELILAALMGAIAASIGFWLFIMRNVDSVASWLDELLP
jgi:hypothetical protein